MLWWVTILALAPTLATGDHSSWEGYDWDSSFPIGADEVGPADAEGNHVVAADNHTTLAAAGGATRGKAAAPVAAFEVDSANEADSEMAPDVVTARAKPATAEAAAGERVVGAERFTFWRDVTRAESGSRRMFGGTRATPDSAQGRAVALIDSRGFVHCSGAALTPEWILTASHCLTPSVTSTRTAADEKSVPLLFIYKHPQYKVEQRAVAGGLEVTSLAHDVGLAQTARPLALPQLPPLAETLADMERHDLRALAGRSLTVYGFGRVEGAAAGGGLFSIRTSVGPCVNPAWAPCVCGAGERGVCAGDSGGPVFYNNTQVAVTSLGPMTCSLSDASTSVFTAVRPYVRLIRATVPAESLAGGGAARARDDGPGAGAAGWSRQRVDASRAAPPPPPRRLHAAALAALTPLLTCASLFT